VVIKSQGQEIDIVMFYSDALMHENDSFHFRPFAGVGKKSIP